MTDFPIPETHVRLWPKHWGLIQDDPIQNPMVSPLVMKGASTE